MLDMRMPVLTRSSTIFARAPLVHVAAAILGLIALSLEANAEAAAPTPDKVNSAELTSQREKKDNLSRAFIVRAQILLDQAGFSPGEIDGKSGENLKKAVRAYAEAQGLPAQDRITPEVWSRLASTATEPALITYQIAADDLKGPFLPKLPAKMEEMKDIPVLAYGSPLEALAEKFHMSGELLKALNPGKAFDREGETISVANVAAGPPQKDASRVEIDQRAQTVRVFDRNNKLVAFYPATVGSDEKPSPSGTVKVINVVENPSYTYNPKYEFKGVRSEKPFEINPGPNGPIGSTWIGLSAKSYGIHGTAEPGKVSKSESHGCVRLTNWDAKDLAKRLTKGIPVTFQAARADAEDRQQRKRARRG